MSEHKTNNDIKKIYMLQFKTQNKRKGKKKERKIDGYKTHKVSSSVRVSYKGRCIKKYEYFIGERFTVHASHPLNHL
jgi:hypothetical protein